MFIDNCRNSSCLHCSSVLYEKCLTGSCCQRTFVYILFGPSRIFDDFLPRTAWDTFYTPYVLTYLRPSLPEVKPQLPVGTSKGDFLHRWSIYVYRCANLARSCQGNVFAYFCSKLSTRQIQPNNKHTVASTQTNTPRNKRINNSTEAKAQGKNKQSRVKSMRVVMRSPSNKLTNNSFGMHRRQVQSKHNLENVQETQKKQLVPSKLQVV